MPKSTVAGLSGVGLAGDYLDPKCLCQVDVPPRPLPLLTSSFSICNEWFANLLAQRAALCQRLSIPNSIVDSPVDFEPTSLPGRMLQCLQSAKLERDATLGLLRVLLECREEGLRAVEFCCEVLSKPAVEADVFSLAVEVLFVLGMDLSPLQALRCVPFLLLSTSSSRSLDAIVQRIQGRKPPTYEQLVVEGTHSLLLYFPLAEPFAYLLPIVQSLVGQLQMNVIGAGSEEMGFSPSSFLAMGFRDELNPPTSFTVEVWVSISAACDVGGTVISSCMDGSGSGGGMEGEGEEEEEDGFRGYAIECQRVSQKNGSVGGVQWRFRFGQYVCVGESSARVEDGPSNNRDEDKDEGKDTAFVHVVGVYSLEERALLLYLDGKLAQRVSTQPSPPLVNLDSPLFCGSGASQGRFFGQLRDFALYSSALSPADVDRHWEASLLNPLSAAVALLATGAEEEDDEDGALPIRVLQYLCQQPRGDLVDCTMGLEACFVDLLGTNNERALDYGLNMLERVGNLSPKLEQVLIDLVVQHDMEQAAVLLAGNFSRSPNNNALAGETAIVALAGFFRKTHNAAVLDALLVYTRRPLLATARGVQQVLECLVDAVSPQLSPRRIIHSALCLMLARSWDLGPTLALKCLPVVGNVSLLPGGDLDFELCVVELVCVAAFDVGQGNAPGEKEEFEDLLQVESIARTDYALFDRVQTALPMPPVHSIRIRNKPFESNVLSALGSIFTVLLEYLFHKLPISKHAGLALRCLRSSWTMVGFLIHNKHGFTRQEASARVQLACDAMACLPIPPSQQDVLFDTTLQPQDNNGNVGDDNGGGEEGIEREEEEDNEEDLKRHVLDSIAQVAERGAEFVHQFQSQMKASLVRSLQQSDSLGLLANLQPVLSLESKTWTIARALQSGGLGASAQLATREALGRLVHAYFPTGGDRGLELCLKYLELAPAEAFDLCVSRLGAGGGDEGCSDSRAFRFANDALDLAPKAPCFSQAHFVPNATTRCTEDGLISLLPQDLANAVAIPVLSTHALFSGKLSFELAHHGEGEQQLVQVGLSDGEGDAVCGCTTTISPARGLRVEIDLDAGRFGVFGVKPLESPLMMFECLIPSTRPLRSSLCVLTPRAAVSFKLLQQEEGVFAGPLASGFAQSTKMLACGQNVFGELGVGDLKSRKRLVETHAAVSDLFPCAIAAGNEFSAVVSSQGQVFAWGMNTKGSCAVDPAETHHVLQPTLVRALQSRIITRLCCHNGSENVFAIAADSGETFAWGFNRFGNLGLGTLDDVVFTPTLVAQDLPAQVVDVANGYSHTLVLTADRRVFSMGLNTHGQLGVGAMGDIRPFCNPVQNLSAVTATAVAVGLLHSAVVDSNGQAWTFGRNDFGQLGLGAGGSAAQILPAPIPITNGKVEKLACGYQFTILSTDTGKLLGCGKNDAGQLGLGHTRDAAVPELILACGRVAALSCGSGHWICATTGGKLLTCGRNKAGATGDGTTANRLVPIELDLTQLQQQQPLQVCQLAAGFHHTLVLFGALNPHWFVSRGHEQGVASRFVLACCRKGTLEAKEWLDGEIKLAPGGRALDYILAFPKPHPVEWLGACVELVMRLGQEEEQVAVLALEWLVKLPPLQDLAMVVRRLVVMASQRDSRRGLVVASQAVYVLRAWLGSGMLGYATLSELLEEEDGELALGVVAVLGGELEVVRRGGRARLGEDVGTVVWHSSDAAAVVAKLELDDGGGCVFAMRGGDLVPESRLPCPTAACPEDLFERIVTLTKRHHESEGKGGRLALAACKAMSQLLVKTPGLVSGFVQRGHLVFLSSLLRAHEQAADEVHALERLYAQLLMEEAPSLSSPLKATSSPPPERAEAAKEEQQDEVWAFDLNSLDCGRGTVDAIDLEVNGVLEPVAAGKDALDYSVDVFYLAPSRPPVPLMELPVLDSFTVLVDVMFRALPQSDVELVTGWTLLPSGQLACGLSTSKVALPASQLVRLAFVQVQGQHQQAFVDGVLAATCSSSSCIRKVFLHAACDMVLTSLQCRQFATSADELWVLGKGTARGIPLPTPFANANGLRDQVQLPLVWCHRALEQCRGSRVRALHVLTLAKPAMLRQARANIDLLDSNLGFDPAACAQAVCETTTLSAAVEFLVDAREGEERDPFAAKAMSSVLALHSHTAAKSEFVRLAGASVDGAVGLVRAPAPTATATSPKVSQSNETFTLQDTCKADKPQRFSSIALTAASNSTNISLAQVEATLFSMHARSAIVQVLDLDSKHALLGSNTTRQFFVRDYMRAFHLKGEGSDAADRHQHHPANVLRRKLLAIVSREAGDCTASLLAVESAPVTGPPHLAASERRRARQELDRRLWQSSVCKSLLQILLGKLAVVRGASSGSLRLLNSGLQVAPAHAFQLVGVLADDLAAYRPVSAVEGFYPVGDALDCTGECLMVKDAGEEQLLAKPLGFELQWEGSSNSKVRLWRPIPPAGFAALGLVAALATGGAPLLDCMRCVRVSCLSAGKLRAGVWEQEDFTVWTLDNPSRTFTIQRSGEDLTPLSSPSLPSLHEEEDLDPILDAFLQQDERAARAFQERVCDKAQRGIVPLALTGCPAIAKDHDDATDNAESAFWVLNLLVEMMAKTEAGEVWRDRVFCAPVMRALFRLRQNGSQSQQVQALRALSAICSPVLAERFANEFDLLRGEVKQRLELEALSSTGGPTLHSSTLCAMIELLAETDGAEATATGNEGNDQEDVMRELGLVMDALLSSSATSRLPNEFLLAEDGFLKLARPEDTKLVHTSKHPYDPNEPLQGECKIANAQSLMLRFDQRSATRFGHALGLRHGMDAEDDGEEFLQGQLGGRTVQLAGNSFSYRFPVPQHLNWCLNLNARGKDIKLSASQLTGAMRKDKVWQTCTATRSFSSGIATWQVLVEKCTPASNIFFGVTRSPFPESYVGSNEYSYGFIGCSALWTNGRKVKQFGDRVKQKDVVTVTLDFYRRSLHFAINGVDQGPAFERLEPGSFFPAFSFYNKHDQITILRGSQAH
ncbi:hypothetical protein BASA81_012420 [Batrachochytrium salamandrivorans]|nr:hypothetical protein BASA81_012420 [Batrachochytrium salamandrivorans]